MKFDYNFLVCPICSKKMRSKYEGSTDLWCANGCCKYEVDPQGENVDVKLFDEETFLIELYEQARLQWSPLNETDYEIQKELDKDMKRFLERVAYWKEDDRYLMKIIAKGY